MNPRFRIVCLPDGDRLLVVDGASGLQMDSVNGQHEYLRDATGAKGVVVLDGAWDVQDVTGRQEEVAP